MSKSKIEWTDETWNPVTGCSKVSAGCKHCYAEREWPRMTKLVLAYAGRAFTDVRTHADRLDQPLRWKKSRMIFVNSMSDLFHEAVPFEFINSVFAVMELAPQHIFQVLTKRPGRMREYMLENRKCRSPLPNVWLGVSVEDQASADERIPLLLDTPAAVRWISAEPLLGPVDLSYGFGIATGAGNGSCPMHLAGICPEGLLPLGKTHIHWVVAGGESGPKSRPMHPDWARSLRDQCAQAGVPFLFKQWGEWFPSAGLPKDTLLPWEKWGYISENGGEVDRMHCKAFKDEFAHHELMARIGRTKAGRLLDGVRHDGYPEGGAA